MLLRLLLIVGLIFTDASLSPLSSQVPRYDATRLAQNLYKKASIRNPSGSTYFAWKDVGFQAGVCFNSLPTHVSFLYGPLDSEYKVKERKKVERRKKEAAAAESDGEEEEHPEDQDQRDKKQSDGNELSAVETHMKVISKTLHNRYKKERENAKSRQDAYVQRISRQTDDERVIAKKKKRFLNEAAKVNAVQNLFNPSSFTQTVENVFHFSFLVKNNLAGIDVRDAEKAMELGDGVEGSGAGPGPVIMPVQDAGDTIALPRQAIVSLNMKVSCMLGGGIWLLLSVCCLTGSLAFH
jgi:hypothetical protein